MLLHLDQVGVEESRDFSRVAFLARVQEDKDPFSTDGSEYWLEHVSTYRLGRMTYGLGHMTYLVGRLQHDSRSREEEEADA